MAYAERRGDYYRGRYKNPPGVSPRWGTVSEDGDGWPFTEKQKALDAANDKEAEIRRLVSEWGRLTEGHTPPAVDGVTLEGWKRLLEGLRRRANGGRDPNAGEVSLREWLTVTWWPAQDLTPRTVDRYEDYLEYQILPHFGDRPINSLIEREEFNAWEIKLRGQCSATTAASARSLLSTILGDAKDAGLVQDNAAGRRRGRGRKRGRKQASRAKVSTKVWATPLESLLLAERCALLTGRDDDLVMWLTGAWCGLRWGELIGLEEPHFQLSALRVDQQLSELNGAFTLEGPKDDSYRDDSAGFFGALELPPFLMNLLSEQVKRTPPGPCNCPHRRCGGAAYLWLGPRRGHYNRSDYGRRTWHPAVDGVYPGEERKRARAARPVLVDPAAGGPGVPLRPPWPFAAGESWQPPHGQGRPRWEEPEVDARAVACPACNADQGLPCRSRSAVETLDHRPRRQLAADRGHVRVRVLASWLPLKPGLTPHGLRHSHRVWMDEDQLPEIMKRDRLGHMMTGMGGTYGHVSPSMRAQLKEALQARWETALAQRLKLWPTSPVQLLDEQLAPLRKKHDKIISRTSPDRERGPVPLRWNRALGLGRAGGI